MEESRLRILFLTLEYSDPFSGNGVYSRSIVQNLVSHAGCKVMVICAKPGGAPGLQKRQQVKSKHDSFIDFVEVRTVTVPVWFKLDRSSSWQEYGQGAFFLPTPYKINPQQTNRVLTVATYISKQIA